MNMMRRLSYNCDKLYQQIKSSAKHLSYLKLSLPEEINTENLFYPALLHLNESNRLPSSKDIDLFTRFNN